MLGPDHDTFPKLGPRGAVLSHRNLIVTARNAAETEGLAGDEEILSYLSVAWAGHHSVSDGRSILTGFHRQLPGERRHRAYGITEASVFITIQRDGEVRLDTMDMPVSEVEVRRSAEGEDLIEIRA